MRKFKALFLYGFLALWGALFAGVPLAATVVSDSENVVSAPLVFLFAVIGAGVFLWGVIGIFKCVVSANVIKNGLTTSGKYLGERGVGAVNGVNYYKIVFEYYDGDTRREATSAQIFTREQADKYKNSVSFSVRYLGKKADVDPDGEIISSPENGLNACEYCKSLFLGEKCPYCGATKKRNDNL